MRVSLDKRVGACAAVLLITGLDLTGAVAASIAYGSGFNLVVRFVFAGAFLFLGGHLFLRGPRFSRIAGILTIGYLALRLSVLTTFYADAHIWSFVTLTAVLTTTAVTLFRLPQQTEIT